MSKLTRDARNRPVIEGAHLMWKNFSGTAKQYNAEGDRNVTLRIDDEEVFQALVADGYNVKEKEPREGYEEGLRTLQISVGYKEGNRPPQIIMITSRGRTVLTEQTIGALDFSIIKNADIIINPFNWGPIQGKSGVKAYLETAYLTIEENPLELKYGADPAGDPVDPESGKSNTVHFEEDPTF